MKIWESNLIILSVALTIVPQCDIFIVSSSVETVGTNVVKPHFIPRTMWNGFLFFYSRSTRPRASYCHNNTLLCPFLGPFIQPAPHTSENIFIRVFFFCRFFTRSPQSIRPLSGRAREFFFILNGFDRVFLYSSGTEWRRRALFQR